MKYEALVLLGCRVGADDWLSPAADRRCRRAARAYAEGLSALVVVSGGRRWGGQAEAEVMGRALTRLGVPESAVVPELLSLSTCENAFFAAQLLRARGLGTVGVVTCDWHMQRALACFGRAGLEAQAVPAAAPQVPRPRRLLRALRESLRLWLDKTATFGWQAR